MTDVTALHDPHHAAALAHAAALRALYNYRGARERAEFRGDNLSGLFEPPPFNEIGQAYEKIAGEYFDQGVGSASVARCALDLMATIATDQLVGEIADHVGPVTIERDRADMLRLISALSLWVNKCDIGEAVAAEHRKPNVLDTVREVIDRVRAGEGGAA